MSDVAPEASPETPRPRWRRVTGSFWFQLLAAFVVLALIQGFLVKVYAVPSASMQDTLEIGDRILVNRLAYVGAEPATGDIVVFNASDAWESETDVPSNPFVYALTWLGGLVGVGPSLDHALVKRVIAGPGQTISCCGDTGRITVDGEPLDEPYLSSDFAFEEGVLDCETEPASTRCFGEYTVPEGEYVVLGDNRTNSADSLAGCRGGEVTDACVRLVRREDIVGKVFFILLPFARIGTP